MGGERVKGEGEWEGEREGVGGVNEGESCARTAVVRFSPGLARFWSTKDRFLRGEVSPSSLSCDLGFCAKTLAVCCVVVMLASNPTGGCSLNRRVLFLRECF